MFRVGAQFHHFRHGAKCFYRSAVEWAAIFSQRDFVAAAAFPAAAELSNARTTVGPGKVPAALAAHSNAAIDVDAARLEAICSVICRTGFTKTLIQVSGGKRKPLEPSNVDKENRHGYQSRLPRDAVPDTRHDWAYC
jgi:hypothetical protein